MDTLETNETLRINRSIKTISLFDLGFLMIFGITSLIISIYSYLNSDFQYSNVYLLPFFTGMLFIFSILKVKNLKQNIINMMILILYFIRNSLSILLLVLANYQSKISIGTKVDVDNAILLMILETLVVFIFLSFLNRNKIEQTISLELNISIYFKLFLLSTSIICILIYILSPDIRNSYVSIIFGRLSNLKNIIPNSGLNLLMFRIFNFIFPILQFFLPLYFIFLIKKINKNKFRSLTFSIMLSLTPMLFVGNESAYSLIMSVSLMLTILKLYPKYEKKLYFVLGTLSIVVLFLFFFRIYDKLGGYDYSSISYITSDFFQSYFPGLTNIGGSFRIQNEMVNFRVFFNDFIRMLPLRDVIFSNTDLSLRTIFIFHEFVGDGYQIMPNVSMAYLYVGYLSPFVSGLMIFIANKYYHKTFNDVFSLASFYLVAIYFAVTPIMYNYAIVGTIFFDQLIWILIINAFIVKSRKKV